MMETRDHLIAVRDLIEECLDSSRGIRWPEVSMAFIWLAVIRDMPRVLCLYDFVVLFLGDCREGKLVRLYTVLHARTLALRLQPCIEPFLVA